ncbi:MAG: TetR/AcrR family transcriptional regulator [Caulobacteraceae bacterium]|nr:TetR/AcrR family transcriptional regulator [Caulobacteraceae bacterium]
MTAGRDSRVRRTRERLRAAMVSLTREQGYTAWRVADLLERADVGRATFYAHYRDKEDLLISMFLDMIDHFERLGLAEEPGSVLPGARQLLRHFHESKAFGRALARDDKMQVLMRACEARLRRGLESRLPANCNPPVVVVATLAAGAFATTVNAWMSQGWLTPPDELADQLEALLGPGVRAAMAPAA